MFQHDFRRLALARDLLAEARRCGQPAHGSPEPDPPDPPHPTDTPDHIAANQD